MQGLACAYKGRVDEEGETLDAAIHTFNAFEGSSIRL